MAQERFGSPVDPGPGKEVQEDHAQALSEGADGAGPGPREAQAQDAGRGMTHDPVMHALIDLCEQITKAPVLSEEMKVAYARALDVIRENVAPGGERGRYVGSRVSVPVGLAKYAVAVLGESRESLGDLDGGFLQDTAEACGVIAPVKVTEPCDPMACACAEAGEFPMECYRYTKEVRQAIQDIEALPTISHGGDS